MASNRITVVVTVTDYTTVFPTSLHTTSIPDATTTLTLTEYTTIWPASSLRTPISDATSSSLAHTTGEPSSAGTTSPLSVHSCTRSSSASSPMTSSSLLSKPNNEQQPAVPVPVPAPAPAPAPAPIPAFPSHYNNALPVLMILCLILIALFFLGALIYFAWRLARGHCADCDLKTADIVHLKQRLAGTETVTPEMVRQRERGTMPGVVMMGLGRGQEVAVRDRDLEGEGITVSLEDPERGVRVRLEREMEKGRGALSGHSERSDPFDLENAVPVGSHFSAATVPSRADERTSKHSATSLFRSGLSMEANRALALVELERNDAVTQEELQSPIPFWKRALARVGVKNVDRGEAVKRNEVEDSAERKPQSMIRIYSDSGRAPVPPALLPGWNAQRTFSRPGPAPPPPVPVPTHRRVPTNPYAFNPRSAYFEDTGESSSGRGSSNAVPRRYLQPQSGKSEFITVGLEDAVDTRRATEIRNKRRTGGYGGMASITPPGMDGDGWFPRRV
ncbi:hypothetical protein P171DRAFT_502491 [Karstenula rhodostoma CBS 690.94]|uniref:Uncharacterized protein n=1 Tax=Karstenula rhodostoma CBS 690.94 TaxID=1392251 RepID=A0A9P4UFL4_9PLEO|nr:hypothetical protein P171DRAFT_502491 [Karstenula rhodostoma CBS 690.94]